MTAELRALHQTVLAVVRSVTRKGGLIVCIAAGAVLIYLLIRKSSESWWFMPASILFGGGLCLLNFRWLAFAVERKLTRRVAPSEPTPPARMLLNGLKLIAVFITLFVVIKWKLVHIFGMVIGLSLGFLAIIWEGLAMLGGAPSWKE